MQPFNLLILSLATWYTGYVLTSKPGPWGIFARFRSALPLGGLTLCMPCFSVWIGAALYLLSLTALAPALFVLAAAGAAMLLHRFTGGDY